MGTGSFNAGRENTRFETFVASGAPLAQSLVTHWTAMSREVANDAQGPLLQPVQTARADVTKLQHSFTMQRGRVRFQALDVHIRALPDEDIRRAAWVNLDRFATAWVTAVPCNDAFISNTEFQEIATFFVLFSTVRIIHTCLRE